MPNLSAISAVTTAATALSNLILVSPQTTVGYQPQNAIGSNGASTQLPPSLIFNYEGEQTASLESDITDHYIEDNTALQDQIALRPETITTHGFIGELNDIAPPGLSAVQTVANKLTIINAYTPVLSATALLAYNEAFQAYQIGANAVNSAISSWSSLTGSKGSGQSVIGSSGLISQSGQNKQQIAFQQFYGYWRNRTLFTVQTPWAVFANMAIKSLRAIQDAETNVITDFEISFKMIRIAATSILPGFSTQGRLTSQVASLVNNGTSTPIPSIPLTTAITNNGLPL